MAQGYLSKAFGFIEKYLTDDLVELSINADGRVWVENRGDSHMRDTGFVAYEEQVKTLADQIANEAKIRFSREKPVFSSSIYVDKWQVRAQIVREPAIAKGYALSMRFFNPAAKIFTPAWLYGQPVSASEARRRQNLEMRHLAHGGDLLGALHFAVEYKLNLIVSGGTNSGKTMVARYLQGHVSDDERIITIEDAPDLLPKQPNRLELVSLPGDAYRSPDKLLSACLRLRPDRIILSEVRSGDAYTFLKAINTGHGGSMTTLHADTAELAVSRLAQAALEAAPGMSYAEMKDYIAQSIDVIVHTANVEGKRGIIEIFLPREDLDAGTSEQKEILHAVS